ncbi:hypothetical protein [Mycolicibacterium sp. P1-5]|uniref:hypothetical protein n=1 Tax=Mycolicibacterium sp. P1-5 TaxID=2024617 RepID=UPI0011EE0245|nr:hypothetical protein [Mycolicibacterium sp. P1-5]KAA0105610.1 hypothetical protein CIW47_19655 [Mycolicibacterium sp. P1-5]
MLSVQLVIAYLSAAALVTGGAMAFAAWSRRSQPANPGVTAGPAVLAGALWPLIIVGMAQWVLVHALGKALRQEPARDIELIQLNTAA